MIGGIAGGAGAAAAGAALGGLTGAAIAINQTSRANIIKELKQQDIQVVQYGDTMTLIVPTDKIFEFGTPKINDICYPSFLNIVRLLKSYKCACPIYVAAFTDNVGSRYHKRMLTQARAEAMLTFLWANNIPAQRMSAEGYEDKYAVGDNKLIRGSAYNRRIEIQWLLSCNNIPQKAPIMSMK
jgi:outer membrane protein OmpA-like peptidoglycan-associated protein